MSRIMGSSLSANGGSGSSLSATRGSICLSAARGASLSTQRGDSVCLSAVRVGGADVRGSSSASSRGCSVTVTRSSVSEGSGMSSAAGNSIAGSSQPSVGGSGRSTAGGSEQSAARGSVQLAVGGSSQPGIGGSGQSATGGSGQSAIVGSGQSMARGSGQSAAGRSGIPASDHEAAAAPGPSGSQDEIIRHPVLRSNPAKRSISFPDSPQPKRSRLMQADVRPDSPSASAANLLAESVSGQRVRDSSSADRLSADINHSYALPDDDCETVEAAGRLAVVEEEDGLRCQSSEPRSVSRVSQGLDSEAVPSPASPSIDYNGAGPSSGK